VGALNGFLVGNGTVLTVGGRGDRDVISLVSRLCRLLSRRSTSRPRSSKSDATDTNDAIRATGVLRGVKPIPPVELADEGVGEFVERGMTGGIDVEDTDDENEVVELSTAEDQVEFEEIIEDDGVEKVFIGVQLYEVG
jgi:hypothetical protein